jgi:carotenoid 1,2-hydratase
VFSPYYASARSRGAGDPLQHCAVNVALYGEGFKRWALTERRGASVRRSRSMLSIGPSSLSWDGTALTIAIDEITFPLPSRIRGTVRLMPEGLSSHAVALDRDGRHRWSPIAPCAQVEVALAAPEWRWSGAGYLDSNAGDAPLETAFSRWHWSRASTPAATLVHYDVDRRDGSNIAFSTRFDRRGAVEPLRVPPRVTLPRTAWGIARGTRADASQKVSIARTFEDTPFYARSLLAIEGDGATGMAMHESLSLERFRTRWVKWLLPFRMPRSRR